MTLEKAKVISEAVLCYSSDASVRMRRERTNIQPTNHEPHSLTRPAILQGKKTI